MPNQSYGLLVRTMSANFVSTTPQTEPSALLSALWKVLGTRTAISLASLFLALTLVNGLVSGLTNSGVLGA